PADERLLDRATLLAQTVTRAFGLVGVNGVDFVARRGLPWAIEVNPRYTAAMELVERAYGISMFDVHVRACRHSLPTFDLADARNACALGAAWFGDGTVPTETRVNGRSASLEQALTEAAGLLTGATHPLVYLAGDLSCETQREAVAIADRLHAALDSLAATAATAVLAAQRRGRAGATLGEIR